MGKTDLAGSENAGRGSGRGKLVDVGSSVLGDCVLSGAPTSPNGLAGAEENGEGRLGGGGIEADEGVPKEDLTFPMTSEIDGRDCR
mgnify:CR=1 FL=1